MRKEVVAFLKNLESSDLAFDFRDAGLSLQRIVRADTSEDELAESIALNFVVKSDEDDDDKTTIYHHLMSGTREDGTTAVFPDRDVVDDDMVAYWKQRYAVAKNPHLKFRYADLVLDFTEKSKEWMELASEQVDTICSLLSDPVFIAILVDNGDFSQSTKDMFQSRDIPFPKDNTAWLMIRHSCGDLVRFYAKRSLQLALLLKKDELVKECAQRIIGLFQTSFNQIPFFPLLVFSELVENASVYRRLTDEQKLRTVDLFESYAKTCIENAQTLYGYDTSAVMLCRYYDKHGDEAKVKEVLELVTSSFYADQYLGGSAMRKVAALERLISIFSEFSKYPFVKAILARLQIEMLEIAKDRGKEMHSIKVEHQLTEEQSKAFDSIVECVFVPVEGVPLVNSIIMNVFRFFLPDRNSAESAFQSNKEAYIYQFVFPQTLIGEDGFTIAVLRDATEDDGHFVQHYTQNIDFMYLLLGKTMHLMRQKLNPGQLKALFCKCAFYREEDNSIIDHILKAYWANDNFSFSSLAIPYIERSIRYFDKLNGIPILRNKPNRFNGYEVASLDTLINEEMAVAVYGDIIGKNLCFYLRTILLDCRSYNLRNNFSHGINLASLGTQFMADLLFHVMTSFLLVRKTSAVETESNM